MKLKTIDKVLYRKRMNRLIVAHLSILMITALSVSNLLIHFFGGEEGSNFWLNVAGVVSAVAAVSLFFYVIKDKPFMEEINYVRELKAEMNRIYRSSAMLEAALAEDNETAIIISYFNLQASKQVYELDDNTLTMEELNEKIDKLDEKIESLGLSVSLDDYRAVLLEQIK